jgi:hypothetical protein
MEAQISQYVEPSEMLRMRFLETYMRDDAYPFAESFHVSDVCGESKGEPGPEYNVVAEYKEPKYVVRTYMHKDGQAVVQQARRISKDERFGDSITTNVLAKTQDIPKAVKRYVKGHIETFIYKTDDVEIGFWQQTPSGAGRTRRFIASRPWDSVSRNYSADVASTLGKLMKTEPTAVDGRIALFYGVPGTGKTSFLRALAHTWGNWASLEYIVDPEHFLNNGTYISTVMLDQSVYNTAQKDKWRIIALEDAGELITADAKQKSGQALSRLLNIADGLLGEGTNVILAITTNEDISALHPALVRPGRCLVKAEIGPLSQDEAKAWIGPEHADKIDRPMTIAELYHIKNGLGADVNSTKETESESVGLYL